MSRVVVVATFEIQEGKGEEAKALLHELIEGSHAEAGCLSYALHRDNNDPNVFVIVEVWTSQVALEAHFQHPYVKALAERGPDVIASPPVIRFCAPLTVGDPVKGAL